MLSTSLLVVRCTPLHARGSRRDRSDAAACAAGEGDGDDDDGDDDVDERSEDDDNVDGPAARAAPRLLPLLTSTWTSSNNDNPDASS